MFDALRSAFHATVEGSRALSAARAAYAAGKPLPEIVAAWADETEWKGDDDLPRKLTEVLTAGANVLRSAAIVLVQVGIRLELQLPALIHAFEGFVVTLEKRITPILAALRSAADRADRELPALRSHAQAISSRASAMAAALDRLKGDG